MAPLNSTAALVAYIKSVKVHGVFNSAHGPVYAINPETLDRLLAEIESDLIEKPPTKK